MENLINEASKVIQGSSKSPEPFEALIAIEEKFNPTSDGEFEKMAKELKITSGVGGGADQAIDKVYDKFLTSQYTEKQASQFMKLLMTFASKGYTPKIKSSTKAKLQKFIKGGMKLEASEITECNACKDREFQAEQFAEHYILEGYIVVDENFKDYPENIDESVNTEADAEVIEEDVRESDAINKILGM